MELHSTIDTKTPRTGWILNLGISGSIGTNKVEKAVSWNVGPHGYKASKEEVLNFFEQDPPSSASRMYEFRNEEKTL